MNLQEICINFQTRFNDFMEEHFFAQETQSPYRYTRSEFALPGMISRLLCLKQTKKDRRVRRFGRVRSNILYYITPTMLILNGLVIFAIFLKGDVLIAYFQSGIYLNAVILSLAIFGIIKSYHNSYLLYCTAKFIKKIEEVMRKDVILEDDIKQLFHYMEKKAVLVNTKYMAESLLNLKDFGHPNFNDNRARLIKSKLGYRVAKKNSEVTFISGILVMLGLLGTFLGLLKTIDSVGMALAGMADMGGGGGTVGVEEMSGFIGSLAAPLQGMGLAFSSSLFGLSGSLFIGFFSHTTGTPQNEFMENVSRWIDDRIAKFEPGKADNVKDSKPPASDDLKSLLAGYAYQSVQTNNKISRLIFVMSKHIGETANLSKILKDIKGHQLEMAGSLQSIDSATTKIAESGETHLEKAGMMLASLDKVNVNVAELRQISGVIPVFIPSISEKLTNMGNHIVELSGAMGEGLGLIKSRLEARAELENDFVENIQNIARSLQILRALQNDLSAIGERILAISGALAQNLEIARINGQYQNESSEEINKQLVQAVKILKDLSDFNRELSVEIKGLSQELGEGDTKSSENSVLMCQLMGILEEVGDKIGIDVKNVRDEEDFDEESALKDLR